MAHRFRTIAGALSMKRLFEIAEVSTSRGPSPAPLLPGRDAAAG
ncbi:hypothetical protein [Sphingomonas sp. PP-F2F-G114-C0414]|nr:hypothetical protein [Sphingomonas sp. PP-F2F-G114-C0414]